VAHISNINTPKSIYYENFHFVIKCGIILGGNSTNSGTIFTLQKKIIIIMSVHNPESHVEIFLNN
jgi:hypothetical protein